MSSNLRTDGLFHLSADELSRYRKDGYLIRESVLTDRELEHLRQASEDSVNKAMRLSETGKTYLLDNKRFVDIDYLTVQFEHEINSQTIKVIEPVYQLDPRFDTLLDDPRLVQPMCDIIGSSELALWTAKLNLKRPYEGSGFGWHQDSPYWVHDSDHVDLLPNVMVAFDDANETNGCLRVIRASHLQGCLAGTEDGSQLGGFYTDPNAVNGSEEVLLEVPAGSLIFFDPHSIHGSLPNNSDQARRAIIITYQPPGFKTLKSKRLRSIRNQQQVSSFELA